MGTIDTETTAVDVIVIVAEEDCAPLATDVAFSVTLAGLGTPAGAV
jgi:hypothetical protein